VQIFPGPHIPPRRVRRLLPLRRLGHLTGNPPAADTAPAARVQRVLYRPVWGETLLPIFPRARKGDRARSCRTQPTVAWATPSPRAPPHVQREQGGGRHPLFFGCLGSTSLELSDACRSHPHRGQARCGGVAVAQPPARDDPRSALGPGRRAVCHDARVELPSARTYACPLSPFAPPSSGLRHSGGPLVRHRVWP
jgi:hypothetical protein